MSGGLEVGWMTTWLKTPEQTWHCYRPTGVALCGSWEVRFACAPPGTSGRAWGRGDRVCRWCRRQEKLLTFWGWCGKSGAVVIGLRTT